MSDHFERIGHNQLNHKLKITRGGIEIDNGGVSGSLTSTGSFGYLNVEGDTVIGGNLTFGDAATDSVSFSAEINSNLIPDADSTYNIGSTSKNWNYGHIEQLSITHVTASGDISSSATITGNELKGGITQNTGSFDFPGAIMGYTILGKNLGHETYTLTTSYAVPANKFNVVFVAPTSGIVEINFAGGLHRDSNTGLQYFYLGLSDAAVYNAVQSYYEQNVGQQDETGYQPINHSWVVDGLTPGNTYQYWIGMRVSSATSQYFNWAGNSSNRNPDVCIKVTALPSNTYIET